MQNKQISKFLLGLITFSVLLMPYSGLVFFLVTGILLEGVLFSENTSPFVLVCSYCQDPTTS